MTFGSVVNRNIPRISAIEFFAREGSASLRARPLWVGALAPTVSCQGTRALAPEEKSSSSPAWCSIA
jgi:hypothetical protein